MCQCLVPADAAISLANDSEDIRKIESIRYLRERKMSGMRLIDEHPAASFWRTLPSRPRASAHIRASACDPHDAWGHVLGLFVLFGIVVASTMERRRLS